MAVKWKWNNAAGSGSVKDLEHRVDQLESELTPIQNNITTLQNEQTSTGNQLNTLSGEAVKITGAQTIDGTKTLNTSLQLANNTYLAKGGTRLSLATLVAQGQKTLDILFVQPTAGYRNYCDINLNVKNGSNATVITVFTLQTRDTNAGVYARCEGDKFIFSNPTLVGGIQAPVGNNDAANKLYVDAIKTKIKEIAGVSTDFADFKRRIGGW